MATRVVCRTAHYAARHTIVNLSVDMTCSWHHKNMRCTAHEVGLSVFARIAECPECGHTEPLNETMLRRFDKELSLELIKERKDLMIHLMQ